MSSSQPNDMFILKSEMHGNSNTMACSDSHCSVGQLSKLNYEIIRSRWLWRPYSRGNESRVKIFHKTIKLRHVCIFYFLLIRFAKKEWKKCLNGNISQPLQWSVSLESLVRYRRIMHGYSHPKLPPNSDHSDNTSTLPIPVENKGTTQKQCAAKSNGVNHSEKNWKQTKWQCSKNNTYAW